MPKIDPLKRGGILKEPMVHFMLAGVVIFALFAMLQPPKTSPDVIVLTDADLKTVVEQYRQTWRSEPSAAEVAALVEQLVREEVFYREGLAMGLDQGDTVIRQRLRQKLEFVIAATQEIALPKEPELRAWFEANRDRYASPLTLQFDQVLIDDALQADQTRAALVEGADPLMLGRATQLPASVQAEAAEVDAEFGPGFADVVAALPIGDWTGPVTSSYGLHMVRVIAVTRAAVKFEALRDRVEADWLRDATQRRMDAAYAAMRDGYEVRLPPELQK